MSLQVSNRSQFQGTLYRDEYEIADPTLADFGKAEIDLAKADMPGLLEIEAEYGPHQPFRDCRITVSMHMTVQTAAMLETLFNLGADIRCCSCNIFSTQDHAAAAVARGRWATIFAKKGETLQEYWDFILKSLSWPESAGGGGPDIILDAGGDPTLLVHEGLKAEKRYQMDRAVPDPASAPDPEFQIVLERIKEELLRDSNKWHKIANRLCGFTEETTTGVLRLFKKALNSELLAPAMNINDGVVKRLFDSLYGCRHSVLDAILRATDVLIAGKTVVVCGYGAVGKGVANAFRGAGAKVVITEVDPICACQAAMEGFRVKRLEDATTGRPTKIVSKAHIFVTCTGNKGVITAKHLAAMRNNAIVGNIGRFDLEIDMESLVSVPGIRKDTIKPQVDRWVFVDGHGVIILAAGRLMNLGCATGHPSFCMSVLASTHILCALELFETRGARIYGPKVYNVPKLLDEKVAKLHLGRLGAELTFLTPEQAEAIDVPDVNGPFKSPSYGY